MATTELHPPNPAPALSAARFMRLFFGAKVTLANNHLTGLRKHLWIHLCVGLIVIAMIVGLGTAMFYYGFKFLMNQQPFGPPLMNRIVQMVLLTFFSMLIFSNFIIMLTTTYISREVEFLMSQPIGHRRLFMGKLLESTIYSSWAFVVLSFPFFMGLRMSRDLGWNFFIGAFVMVIPYIVIPSAIGAALALIMTAFCPPRKMIRYGVALAVIGVISALVMHRIYGFGSMLQGGSDDAALSRVMRFMGIGNIVFLPSGWLGRGLLALERGDWGEVGTWTLALWSTGLMGLVACDWLAGPLYYRGWCTARTSGSGGRRRQGGLYVFFDRLLRPVSRGSRALLTKDLTVFWRDPSQWGQLCMLFGLLFVYVINLRSAAEVNQLDIFMPFWQALISLLNIGATGFVLSILSTRFVFPMLSLEGKQQWVIGLAPLPRTRLVWIKFWISFAGALALSYPLVALSCFMLNAPPAIYLISAVSVTMLALGLSSLAVGLGALMPNFTEDNPSRIANGLGGTINALASLIYMVAALALEGPWIYLYAHGMPARGTGWWLALVVATPLWLLLHALMVATPMWLGLRRWQRIEF